MYFQGTKSYKNLSNNGTILLDNDEILYNCDGLIYWFLHMSI